MKKSKRFIFILFLVIIFLFLRFYHLRESLTVGTDQGMHLLAIYNLYKEKKISLIGPVSSFKIHGRNFFFGPATYYLSMPFFALSRWNPLSVSYFMIILQLTTFLILYKILASYRLRSKVDLYYALIFTFSPVMVNYARFLWNPNLMVPTSLLLIATLLKLKQKKSHQRVGMITAGFLLGLGMQFHYSYFLVIILTLIWLYRDKKLHLFSSLYLIIGFVIGFSPLILFELRHNFYNLRTFIEFVLLSLAKDNAASVYTPGYIPGYYALSVLPFIYLFISLLLSKLEKLGRLIPLFFILGYAAFSLAKILPIPSSGFLSADGWNYQGLSKAKEIIITTGKKDYNVVDLLTGDTRAMYLRALLTLVGKPPMTIDEYPDTKSLFLYSRVPIDKLLKGSLWEMDVIRPLKLVKTWYLQNGISLYLLEKTEKPHKF